MEALISQYGLLAVVLGAAIEGDVVVMLTGVAAHLHLLRFPEALAAAWLGAVVADCVWYALARRHGSWARQTKTYQLVGPRIEELVGRLGAGEVVIARFIFGTRVVSMSYWGIRGLPFARFMLLDMIGCAIWASALISLGYVFSGSAAALVGEVKRVEVWLSIAVLMAALATIALRRFGRSMMHKGGAP
jgi:membrane protein DedA with SNARE-associated domain